MITDEGIAEIRVGIESGKISGPWVRFILPILDRLEAAEARVRAYEAALKPFAERSKEIDEVRAVARFAGEGGAPVRIEHLRAARAALGDA